MSIESVEYAGAEDRFFDYCLWEYRPTIAFAGKLRSVSLFHQSLDAAGFPGSAHDLVPMLREGIGLDRTVWGLKKKGDLIIYELYFYDYRRRGRETSMSRIIRTLGPIARCNVRPNENLHYFMFSIDLDPALIRGERSLDEIHMYIGNPGSAVSSGIGYSLTPDHVRMENFYFFFEARRHADEILAKVVCSAHLDTSVIDPARVLWPELLDCRVIVVANKQTHDGVYFSGITVDQLIFFLRAMDYPPQIVSYVCENRDRLDHMLYDVGFDYRQEGRELTILKSGYYGFF